MAKQPDPVRMGHPNLILETLAEVAKERKIEFFSVPQFLDGRNEWDEIYVELKTKQFVAQFQLQQMPGCCGVLVVFYVNVNPWTKENFQKVLKSIAEAAYQAGFGSLLMAQVVHKDEIWQGLPWKVSEPFVNAKSGNRVVYLTLDLGQKEKREGLEVEV